MIPDHQEQWNKQRQDHSRTLALTCRPCNKKFASEQELQTHRSQHHPPSEITSSPDPQPVVAREQQPPPPPPLGLAATSARADNEPPSGQRPTHSPPTPLNSTTISLPPSLNPQPAIAGTSTRAFPRNLRPGSTDVRRRLPAHDATSSSSPLASSSRPSRTQTPQLPGSADLGSQMHISQLSLDEHDGRLQSHAAVRLESGPTSKKRPASSEAHDSRTAPPRARHKDHGSHAHGPTQHALTDELGRSNSQHERQHASHADNHAESVNTYSPGRWGKGLEERLLTSDLTYPKLLTDPNRSQMERQDPPPQTTQPLRQASTERVTIEQLEIEISKINRSLDIVEQQCITLDKARSSDRNKNNKPEKKEWSALTNLHRTLLYEHHDFLVACQHPSSTPEQQALPTERQLPFRLWKNAIHAYLEVLRQHLPDTFEFMEGFIYLAYHMMALLHESVPTFEDVWTECMGDLARYRMAIETQSGSIREIWSQVAIRWYAIASDRQPLIGRLYHHLGLLSRPMLAKQLYYYSKSLCCVQSFHNANHSLKALFATPAGPSSSAMDAVDRQFIRLHKLVYEAAAIDQARLASTSFVTGFEQAISDSDKKWKEHGAFLAVSNIAACVNYGEAEHPLRRVLEPISDQRQSVSSSRPSIWQELANWNVSSILKMLVSRRDEENTVLPHIHVIMVFLQRLCRFSKSCSAVSQLLGCMPWGSIVDRLNSMAQSKLNMTDQVRQAMSANLFFTHDGGGIFPLLEDSAMRGLAWCRDYFPKTWFDKIDKDELPENEPANADRCRAQRILWSAVRISLESSYIQFDRSSGTFEIGQRPEEDTAMKE